MPRTAAFALLPCLVLAPLANAGDPAVESLVLTGAEAPGQVALSVAGPVYTFAFTGGDEELRWEIDVSDPKVAGGMLRIHEAVSDSWPMDGAGPVFRDAAGTITWPNTNYKKSVLTGHSASGGVLRLDHVLNLNGTHPFRYEISAQGKQLRVRVLDPTGNLSGTDNFAGTTFGKSTGVENPVPVRMQGALAQPITLFRREGPEGTQHFFTANMLDMFQSNGSDYRIGGLIAPVITADSTTYALDTATRYDALSNGKLAAPLDDAFVIAVSSRIADVLVDSTAPPSPYRNLLANRMVVYMPSSNWASYDAMFDLYLSVGMYSLAGYFFLDWTSSAVDPPSTASVGPDWMPAKDPDKFAPLMQHASWLGHLVGAYTAFNCMPDSAPGSVWDPLQVVKDAAGNAKTYFGLGYPLLGVEASGLHAQEETAALHALGASAVYLDIQTYGSVSKGPDGGHLDQTAGSPWAKTMRQGYAAQKAWFEGMRDQLEGPLLGEGSISTANANMEWLYNGYVDSVQRCVNTGAGGDASTKPAGSPDAPTNWPIIPEYEWRVAARRQVNHGNGFYERFFGPSDGPGIVKPDGLPIYPLTQEALDLYQAFLISYGHAGFITTNGAKFPTGGYLTHPAAAQVYFMTNALQLLYFAAPVTGIGYRHQGAWKSFEQVLFDTETLESFRGIPLRLDFANGLRIYVNHGAAPLVINEDGLNYTLPAETGWYAGMGNGWFRAFSAVPPGTGGQRIDYCKATGQYEYFNGRGGVAAFGGLSNPEKRSAWKVTPTNLSVTENASGGLTAVPGPPPGFLGIQVLQEATELDPGERSGLKAVAYFDNGGVLDLTTLLDWGSTNPAVASVSSGAVVHALSSGNATLVGVAPGGGILSTPVSVTVKVR